MPATLSESGSARKARGRVAEAPRKATGRFGGLGSMPRPHVHLIIAVSGRVRRWNRVFPRKARGRSGRNAAHAAGKAAEGSAEVLESPSIHAREKTRLIYIYIYIYICVCVCMHWRFNTYKHIHTASYPIRI